MHSPLKYLHISTRINVLNIPNLANDHQLIVSKANNTCPQPNDGAWSLQKGTTVVDYDAFKWCGKIKELVIVDTVKTIHERGFESMTNLEVVKWFNADSSKLESIETEAFSQCTKLENFTIPSKVNNVGDKIFNGDTALKTIYVHKSFPLDQYEAKLKDGNSATVSVLDNSKLLDEIKVNVMNADSSNNRKTKNYSIVNSSIIIAAIAVCGLAISIIIVLIKSSKTQKEETNNQEIDL